MQTSSRAIGAWWPAAIALVGLLALVTSPVWPGAANAGPPDPAGETRLVPPVTVVRGADLPGYTGCAGDIAPVVNASYEQQVLDLVNAERASRGLPPLKRVPELDRAARYYATDMGQDDYFPSDHATYDRVGGSLTKICEWSVRVGTYYTGWSSLAENIAAGYSTPQSAMSAWMGSTGHRNNILSTSNWEIGVGYYAGSGYYSRYWVQDFGRRSGIYPLIINQDAASTATRNVSLYTYGQDNWNEMRLRNDDGSWTNWQSFQATQSWTLRNQAGERTVWAELRQGSQTTVTSDTIALTGCEYYFYLPLVRKS